MRITRKMIMDATADGRAATVQTIGERCGAIRDDGRVRLGVANKIFSMTGRSGSSLDGWTIYGDRVYEAEVASEREFHDMFKAGIVVLVWPRNAPFADAIVLVVRDPGADMTEIWRGLRSCYPGVCATSRRSWREAFLARALVGPL